MRYAFLIIASSLFLTCFYSCKSGYKKAEKNFEYLIIDDGSGKKLEYGDYFMFHVSQVYENKGKDTVMNDSRNIMPRTEKLDSSRLPSYYTNILTQARVGDSLVIRISSTDAKLTGVIPRLPKYVKAGGYIYIYIKILESFKNEQAADSNNIEEFKKNQLKIYNYRVKETEAANEKYKKKIVEDAQTIRHYLDSTRVSYRQGKWGTFIVVNKEGSGDPIDYRNVIAVTYEGKKFSNGEVYDSNTDPKFDHVGPYEVALSQLGKVMPGWTDGLMGLRPGSEVTLYIPSSLAYGAKGWKQIIPPNEIVVYNIRIDKVVTEIEAMKIVMENKRRAALKDNFNFGKPE